MADQPQFLWFHFGDNQTKVPIGTATCIDDMIAPIRAYSQLATPNHPLHILGAISNNDVPRLQPDANIPASGSHIYVVAAPQPVPAAGAAGGPTDPLQAVKRLLEEREEDRREIKRLREDNDRLLALCTEYLQENPDSDEMHIQQVAVTGGLSTLSSVAANTSPMSPIPSPSPIGTLLIQLRTTICDIGMEAKVKSKQVARLLGDIRARETVIPNLRCLYNTTATGPCSCTAFTIRHSGILSGSITTCYKCGHSYTHHQYSQACLPQGNLPQPSPEDLASSSNAQVTSSIISDNDNNDTDNNNNNNKTTTTHSGLGQDQQGTSTMKHRDQIPWMERQL